MLAALSTTTMSHLSNTEIHEYFRVGDVHVLFARSCSIPRPPRSGSIIQTRHSWIYAAGELTGNPFDYRPVEAPPRAWTTGASDPPNLWQHETWSLRYTMLALRTSSEPMTRARMYTVMIHLAPLGDEGEESGESNGAGAHARDDEAEALCRAMAEAGM